MTWQDAFNIAFLGVTFLAGFLVNNLWQEIKQAQADQKLLTQKIAAIELLVAGSYLTRAEYRDDLKNITDALLRIEEKLDSKQDKDDRR